MSRMKHNRMKEQSGVVSMVVALVFILVALLIVTGFAQLARRNSRQALDRQLSSQAFYAAESGVNDAIAYLKTVDTELQTSYDSTCNTGASNVYAKNNGVVSQGVSYTCLLVTVNPTDIVYDNVSDSSIIVPLERAGGRLDGDITLTWKKAESATGATSTCTVSPGTLPDVNNWACPYGIMRLDVVPATVSTISDATSAAAAMMTAFVYPGPGTAASASTISYADSSGSNRYNAIPEARQGLYLQSSSCTDGTDALCTVKLSGLGSYQKAYVRIQTLYRSSETVRIVSTDASNQPAPMTSAQAIIDVTGKAQDVLRRIQVRVSLTDGSRPSAASGFSEYALQSNNSICKQYISAPVALLLPSDADPAGCDTN